MSTTLFVLAVTNCSPSLVWYPFVGNNPEHPAPLRIQPIAPSVSNSVQSTCSPSGLCAIPGSTFSTGRGDARHGATSSAAPLPSTSPRIHSRCCSDKGKPPSAGMCSIVARLSLIRLHAAPVSIRHARADSLFQNWL